MSRNSGTAPNSQRTGEQFETFGEYLKFLRRRARLTQEELARAVGYSREQIVRLERNQRLPDPVTLNALFIPALDLQKDSALAARLTEFATYARDKARPPNNLPVQLTSFVGRTQEIAALTELLTANGGQRTRNENEFARGFSNVARLVTLTGVGGTGKTRLALQVARELLPAFRDGVWFIELAQISEPALVPQTIATTLGLREQVGHAYRDALQDFLRHKEILLVLDNCEHLLDACAQWAEGSLRVAPALKILATSREALAIAGEQSYPVQSLALPGERFLLDMLKQSDAVHLFLDRALAVLPQFEITFENAASVVQICARLDGIPLAIELAAACVKGLSVEQIAARLDDRFRLLTGGSRTALPRQRTLYAAIDWSYKLLSDEERALLRCLAVFAGGWTLEAAEFVCAGTRDDENQILDVLLRLVNKSLVVANSDAAEPRYHMLETIRQYAQEKFDESGETETIRARHLEFFAAFAQHARPHLRSPQQLVWMQRLDAEYDNIHAALAWAIASGPAEPGLQLAADLQMFWVYRAYLNEPREMLGKLLAVDSDADALTRARAHFVTGLLEYLNGNLEQGYAHAVKSEALCLALGPQANVTLASARNVIAYTSLRGAQNASAKQKYLYENLKLFREAGDEWMQAHTHFNIGQVLHAAGDLEGAQKEYKKSRQLFRKCGDEFRVMQQTASLAYLAYARRKYAYARTQLEQVYAYFRATRYNIDTDYILYTLGAIALREGNPARARVWYTECVLFDQQLGQPTQLPECLVGFAGIAFAEENYERAAQLLGACQTELERRNLGLERIDREECERLAAALSLALGADEFESRFALGSTLTREQALELALKSE